MKPLNKEIADYTQATLVRIAEAWESADDLKKWWFSQREKDMRASLVISGTTPDHRTLYNAFLARGNELAAGSHIKGKN